MVQKYIDGKESGTYDCWVGMKREEVQEHMKELCRGSKMTTE